MQVVRAIECRRMNRMKSGRLALPLLFGAAAAGHLHGGCAVRGRRVLDGEALVAVPGDDLKPATAGVLETPLLVGVAVAGPLGDPDAVTDGAGTAVDVQ